MGQLHQVVNGAISSAHGLRLHRLFYMLHQNALTPSGSDEMPSHTWAYRPPLSGWPYEAGHTEHLLHSLLGLLHRASQ